MGLLPRAATAVQRYDGHTIWSHDAEYSVPVMAVGGGGGDDGGEEGEGGEEEEDWESRHRGTIEPAD